jgi:hypothetical protein
MSPEAPWSLLQRREQNHRDCDRQADGGNGRGNGQSPPLQRSGGDLARI